MLGRHPSDSALPSKAVAPSGEVACKFRQAESKLVSTSCPVQRRAEVATYCSRDAFNFWCAPASTNANNASGQLRRGATAGGLE
jgi:hypothetical protein